MFINKSQLLQYVRNYGYFSITNDLKKDGNLIDEGRFESEDVQILGSGNETFNRWAVLLGQAGVTFGHETVVNGDSTGAFFFDFEPVVNNQADTQVYSDQIAITNGQGGQIRLKFQYFLTARYSVPYIRIAWVLKFHRISDDAMLYLTTLSNGSIGYVDTEQKNEIYVSSFNTWLTFDILQTMPTDAVDYAVIEFYFHNHYGRDFADRAALKAFSVTTLANPEGVKRMIVDDDTLKTAIYTSEYSFDTELFPDIVVPDDYDGVTNPVIWRLDKIINLGGGVGLLSRLKLDNVVLAFYPNVFLPTTHIIDPPETLLYEENVSDFVEPELNIEALIGDMIRFDEEFTRNEANLYRSYIRLSDGTPTQFWARNGVDEAKRILQIALEDYVSQFSEPQRKLSGAKITNTVLHFVNCLNDTIDGTRYRPMTFTFDALNAIYTPDIVGVLAGADGEPPYNPGQFDCRAFSSAFRRGTCLVEDGIFDFTFGPEFE